jgi:hypothetical protein
MAQLPWKEQGLATLRILDPGTREPAAGEASIIRAQIPLGPFW